MSYKTIFVHVDESPHVERRIVAAARIALAENAHLVGVAMSGVSEFLVFDPMALNPADPAKAPYLENLRQRAAEALSRFEQVAARMGVQSIEARLIENVDQRDISQMARCADLVVVDPWYYGVSFSRYYTGTARWLTLPSCVACPTCRARSIAA